MNAHVEPWLDAYLDGELNVAQRQQVETHLSECPECCTQLEQRQSLSLLLHELPAASELKSESRFVSEVGLRMERKPAAQPISTSWTSRALRLAWYLVPVGLLFVAVFIQATLSVSTVVGLVPGADQALTGKTAGALPSASLSAPLSGVLGAVEFLSLPSLGWLTGMAALGLIGLVYIGWLASWWARNRQAASKAELN